MIPGLFITGTDTGVGKTYVAALIAKHLAREGRKVGVYKPAASGCFRRAGRLVSDDAEALWEAAGRPGDLDHVCPQCFAAPIAPHLAARAEGHELDAALLRRGLQYWLDRAEIVLVEGAGGLLSPMGDKEYVADLAAEMGFPLIVVSRNVLGTINHTLQTLFVAAKYQNAAGQGITAAGVVLNHPTSPSADDASLSQNRHELAIRCGVPILAETAWASDDFDSPVDWWHVARGL